MKKTVFAILIAFVCAFMGHTAQAQANLEDFGFVKKQSREKKAHAIAGTNVLEKINQYVDKGPKKHADVVTENFILLNQVRALSADTIYLEAALLYGHLQHKASWKAFHKKKAARGAEMLTVLGKIYASKKVADTLQVQAARNDKRADSLTAQLQAAKDDYAQKRNELASVYTQQHNRDLETINGLYERIKDLKAKVGPRETLNKQN